MLGSVKSSERKDDLGGMKDEINGRMMRMDVAKCIKNDVLVQ